MNSGKAIILLAALWCLRLVMIGPGAEASDTYRYVYGHIALALVVLTLLSAHLTATWTIFAFSILGVMLHFGVLGVFGVGIPGLVAPILLVIGMWLCRKRLDGRAVVWAVLLASIGIWAGSAMIAGWYIMAIVNGVIWLVNRLKGTPSGLNATSRQADQPAR